MFFLASFIPRYRYLSRAEKFIGSHIQLIHWNKWPPASQKAGKLWYVVFLARHCYLTRKLSANRSFDQMNALWSLEGRSPSHLCFFFIESSNKIISTLITSKWGRRKIINTNTNNGWIWIPIWMENPIHVFVCVSLP